MSDLKVSLADGIARVVFDRPSALNALTPSTLGDLIDACADLARNDSVRVVAFEVAGSCF